MKSGGKSEGEKGKGKINSNKRDLERIEEREDQEAGVMANNKGGGGLEGSKKNIVS